MATASIGWIARNRWSLYPILNLGVLMAAIAGSMAHGTIPGLIVYVCVLFAICSTPILLMRSLGDRYALLAIFMPLYFLFFGALDLSNLLFGTDVPIVRSAFLSPAELAILLGAALVLAGYSGGVELARGDNHGRPPAEWSAGTMLALGLTLWILGTVAILYFQVFAAPEKTNRAAASAFANMGPVLTFFVMLGNMVQPLGILMLAYGYAKHRGALWFALILTVVIVNVGVGFVTDVKRLALMGAVLVIVTRTLVNKRLPKVWILCSIGCLTALFPVFQAYRAVVTGERGLDRLHAVRELDKVLALAFAYRDKVAGGEPGERSQTFLERSSVKGTVEILFDHVGRDVPFLGGSSLVAIPMAFVPRLVAPEKADVSVGQLFNRQVLKADTDTNISISHLGELYWNFGWLGILVGMPLSGLLLGFVGEKFNLERGVSVTRILVLLITMQSLCIGFEGTLPMAYVLWLRGIAAIGLLHLLFARSGAGTTSDASAGEVALPTAAVVPRGGALVPSAGMMPRFPNLMR